MGENETEEMKGEHPYINTCITLNQYTYEEKEKAAEAKPKRSRASRSPPRERAADAEADAGKKHSFKKDMKAGVKEMTKKKEKQFNERDFDKHECIYDEEDNRCHKNTEWGNHNRDQNSFPESAGIEVKVVTPRYEACGQKRIPGRYFVGGHYVSDRW